MPLELPVAALKPAVNSENGALGAITCAWLRLMP
nr:MAG TPA: hypothetical protein [Caudoviricetes sp.]